jgi:16S rRNA (uracil1498-N3)-methyltransferase
VSRIEFARRVDAVGQFRVSDVHSPQLSREDAHHLVRVLRAKQDEEIVVTNGSGSWAFARVRDNGIERVSDVVLDEADEPVTLYLAPLKGDRDEWAVAKATELGVNVIVPLLSERVVVKWSAERGEKALARWRRIAAEAAGQSRRTYDVVVNEPCAVRDVASQVAVAQFNGTGSLDGLRSIAVGPEGGWGPKEWGLERQFVGLGDTVLRAETAALAAVTLLVSQRSGWSRHSLGFQNGS